MEMEMMQVDAARDSVCATLSHAHPCEENLAGRLDELRRVCHGQSLKCSDSCQFNRVQSSGVIPAGLASRFNFPFLILGCMFVFGFRLDAGIERQCQRSDQSIQFRRDHRSRRDW